MSTEDLLRKILSFLVAAFIAETEEDTLLNIRLAYEALIFACGNEVLENRRLAAGDLWKKLWEKARIAASCEFFSLDDVSAVFDELVARG